MLSPAEASRAPTPSDLRRLLWGVFHAPGGLGEGWKAADADGDGKVSRADLAAFYRQGGIGVQVGAGRLPATERLNEALVRLLDRDGDGKLSAAELKAARTVQAARDRNEDELVSPAELGKGVVYPGAAGTTRLGPPGAATALPGPCLPALWLLPADRKDARGAAAELAGWRQRPPDGAWLVRWKRGEPGLFRKDWGLQQLLASSDRDADGKLTRAELDAWLGVLEALCRGQVLVTALDHGRGLFESLDADGDGHLSVRELRTAPSRLEKADCLPGGVLDPKRLPRSLRLTVSKGHPRTAIVPPPRSGPGWFLAMDRNGDGDVSRQEFVGEPAFFDRLDADSDGLLSPEEAERYTPAKRPLGR